MTDTTLLTTDKAAALLGISTRYSLAARTDIRCLTLERNLKMITITLPEEGAARATLVFELYEELQSLYEWANREDNPDAAPRIPTEQTDAFDAVIGMAFAWLEANTQLVSPASDCPVCRGRQMDSRRDGSYQPGCPACGFGRSR